jgi:hypothetical protein
MYLGYFTQPLLCAVGVHMAPPVRIPRGPMVAQCSCCGKATYFYGTTIIGVNAYPQLLLPTFPRVLGPVSTTYLPAGPQYDQLRA